MTTEHLSADEVRRATVWLKVQLLVPGTFAEESAILLQVLSERAMLLAQVAVLLESVQAAFSWIDAAMGDTDPTDENDELLLASQALAPFVGDDAETALNISASTLLREVEMIKRAADKFEKAAIHAVKRAEAAEARVTALEGQQRTPGTVEVCEKCGGPVVLTNVCQSPLGYPHPDVKSKKDCPIKAARDGEKG